MFSLSKWHRFLRSRVLSDAPISFSEIEVELCGIPTPDDWVIEGLLLLAVAHHIYLVQCEYS